MLNDSKIKALKPADKRYSLADGGGLSIDVMPTGKKSWVLEYRLNGNRKRIKLGEYPTLSIKQARALANEKKNSTIIKVITMQAVIDEWLAIRQPHWTSNKYAKTVQYRLDYITERFKQLPVDDVSRAMVTDSIAQMVKKDTLETAKRSLRLLSQVFDYAIAKEYTQKNPCTLVGNIIPKPNSQNMPALPFDEMAQFWCDTIKVPSNITPALMLCCYFACRPSELCNAKWCEFDLNNGVWVIPSYRMKSRLEHSIPIARQPLELLRSLPKDTEYLFKKRTNPSRPIRIESLLALIKRAGYGSKMTTHGFRAVFSTHANDSGLWRSDVIERQLAHSKSDVRHRYNRAEYWDERVRLMQWWADIVDDWLATAHSAYR